MTWSRAEAPMTATDTYLVLIHRTVDGWKVYREVASSRQPATGGGE